MKSCENLVKILFALLIILTTPSVSKFPHVILAQLFWLVSKLWPDMSISVFVRAIIFCEIWIISSILVCEMGLWYHMNIMHVYCLLCFLSLLTLEWPHNGLDSVLNHQPHDCLLNYLFRRKSKKTSKLRAIGICAGNSPGTGEFPAQMVSNAENVSIWWRHHILSALLPVPSDINPETIRSVFFKRNLSTWYFPINVIQFYESEVGVTIALLFYFSVIDI